MILDVTELFKNIIDFNVPTPTNLSFQHFVSFNKFFINASPLFSGYRTAPVALEV